MLIKFEVKIELSVMRILSVLLERLGQISDDIRGKLTLTTDTHDFND